MTTPHPHRGPNSDVAWHADLLTDLTRSLPVSAGLTQVTGGTPAGLLPPADTDPGHAAHTRLVADLTTALRPRTGLATILATESDLAGVVDDLTTTLDTNRGLATILATPVSATDAPLDTPAGPSTPVSADPSPATPSTMDTLTAIYLAPADQRLHLRAGPPSRAARAALRQLDNIRMALARITTGPHPLTSHLDTAPTMLDRQHMRITHALTLMAQALKDPEGDQTEAEDITAATLRELLRRRAACNSTGDHDGAETMARSITDPGRRSRALIQLAVVMASTGDHSEAAALAVEAAATTRSISDPEERSRTMAHLTTVMVRIRDHDWAEVLTTEVRHEVAARSASLLQQTADELAALYDHLTEQPPSTAGVRLLTGCTRRVDQLTATVQQLWTALSDFRGADLRATTGIAVNELEGVRWSDGTAGTDSTRWPAILASDVRQHSQRVEHFPGVWEIDFNAAKPLAPLTG